MLGGCASEQVTSRSLRFYLIWRRESSIGCIGRAGGLLMGRVHHLHFLVLGRRLSVGKQHTVVSCFSLGCRVGTYQLLRIDLIIVLTRSRHSIVHGLLILHVFGRGLRKLTHLILSPLYQLGMFSIGSHLARHDKPPVSLGLELVLVGMF
jgi:hypothetical protein